MGKDPIAEVATPVFVGIDDLLRSYEKVIKNIGDPESVIKLIVDSNRSNPKSTPTINLTTNKNLCRGRRHRVPAPYSDRGIGNEAGNHTR